MLPWKRAYTEALAANIRRNGGENSPYAVFLSTLRAPTSKSAALLQDIKLGEPVPVFTGPAKKQPQSTQVAAADPKITDPKTAKPGTKPAAATGAAKPAMAATAAVPWTSFGPGGLSNNPPSDLTTLLEQAGAADTVPLPLNVMAWPGLADAAGLGKLGVRRLSAGSAIAQALWGRAELLARDFLQDGRSDPLSGGRCERTIHVAHDHVRASASEALGDGGADAGSGAGDERGLARERAHDSRILYR